MGRRRKAQLVDLLIAHGSDLDLIERKNGFSALLLAAQRGNAQIVKALVDAGCNVHIRSYNRRNALDVYCRHQYHHFPMKKKDPQMKDMRTILDALISAGIEIDPRLVDNEFERGKVFRPFII